jgi:ketosteroid isomerase-like protein
MFPDISTVQAFLEQYGKALAAGDTHAVAACYAVPAIVMHDGGASAVLAPGDLERAFVGLADRYHGAGLHEAAPVVERIEALSGELLGVDVDWLSLDADGRPSGRHEGYRYVLRHRPGRLAIQVVIKRNGAVVSRRVPA